jgi:hypothetical protein
MSLRSNTSIRPRLLIEPMLIVDAFDKGPKHYVEVFCRHHKKMDHVHSKNGPSHRAVCVVVPFEMQSVEFVITANRSTTLNASVNTKPTFIPKMSFRRALRSR